MQLVVKIEMLLYWLVDTHCPKDPDDTCSDHLIFTPYFRERYPLPKIIQGG